MIYWDIIKIDSKKYKSFVVNGFDYEKPFNFTNENIDIGNGLQISPGYWTREDIPKIVDKKFNFKIDGNKMIVLNNSKTFQKGSFLNSIGMNNFNEWFFIRIPEQPNEIILNFTFEDTSATERAWNYPISFNKEIPLENDCLLWVSGIKNNKEKVNHPLQRFSVKLNLIKRFL